VPTTSVPFASPPPPSQHSCTIDTQNDKVCPTFSCFILVLRIRIFWIGSGRMGTDPDPGLKIWPILCKFMLFNFLIHEPCLWIIYNDFQAKVTGKFSQVRIRIRNWIRMVWKVVSRSGSGQKSSIFATLEAYEHIFVK
jgi:hypothetical protein